MKYGCVMFTNCQAENIVIPGLWDWIYCLLQSVFRNVLDRINVCKTEQHTWQKICPRPRRTRRREKLALVQNSDFLIYKDEISFQCQRKSFTLILILLASSQNVFIFSENIRATGVICMDICEGLTAFQQILPITVPGPVKKCQNDWFLPVTPRAQ